MSEVCMPIDTTYTYYTSIIFYGTGWYTIPNKFVLEQFKEYGNGIMESCSWQP